MAHIIKSINCRIVGASQVLWTPFLILEPITSNKKTAERWLVLWQSDGVKVFLVTRIFLEKSPILPETMKTRYKLGQPMWYEQTISWTLKSSQTQRRLTLSCGITAEHYMLCWLLRSAKRSSQGYHEIAALSSRWRQRRRERHPVQKSNTGQFRIFTSPP